MNRSYCLVLLATFAGFSSDVRSEPLSFADLRKLCEESIAEKEVQFKPPVIKQEGESVRIWAPEVYYAISSDDPIDLITSKTIGAILLIQNVPKDGSLAPIIKEYAGLAIEKVEEDYNKFLNNPSDEVVKQIKSHDFPTQFLIKSLGASGIKVVTSKSYQSSDCTTSTDEHCQLFLISLLKYKRVKMEGRNPNDVMESIPANEPRFLLGYHMYRLDENSKIILGPSPVEIKNRGHYTFHRDGTVDYKMK